MPRVGQLRAGETLEQFAERMGVSLDELMRLNQDLGLTVDSLMEGLELRLPGAVASSVAQAPQQAPAQSAAPSGELAGGAGGLFQEMLKEFTTAFQTFLSAPAFIQEATGGMTRMQQAQVPGMVGEIAQRPTAGWTRQEAEFLRYMEPELEQRYKEQVQRQFAETGEIPTLTAQEFLRGINVREEIEMTTPGTVRGGRRYGAPSITPRRLRF